MTGPRSMTGRRVDDKVLTPLARWRKMLDEVLGEAQDDEQDALLKRLPDHALALSIVATLVKERAAGLGERSLRLYRRHILTEALRLGLIEGPCACVRTRKKFRERLLAEKRRKAREMDALAVLDAQKPRQKQRPGFGFLFALDAPNDDTAQPLPLPRTHLR